MEKFLKFKKIKIYFEYTTVDGSELKGVVERAFETGYGQLLRYLNAGDSVFENLYVGHRVTKTGLFLAVESDYLGPKTYREARDYKYPEIQKRWTSRTLDVETELLGGELEEEFL